MITTIGKFIVGLAVASSATAFAGEKNEYDVAYDTSKTIGEYIENIRPFAPKKFVKLLETRAKDHLGVPLAQTEKKKDNLYILHAGSMMVPVELFEQKPGEEFKIKINHKMIVVTQGEDMSAVFDRMMAAFPQKQKVSAFPPIFELLLPTAHAGFFSKAWEGVKGVGQQLSGTNKAAYFQYRQWREVNCERIRAALDNCMSVRNTRFDVRGKDALKPVQNAEATARELEHEDETYEPTRCSVKDAEDQAKYRLSAEERPFGLFPKLKSCVASKDFQEKSRLANGALPDQPAVARKSAPASEPIRQLPGRDMYKSNGGGAVRID